MRYTTQDELNYIAELYRRDPQAAREYCRILLGGRRWDPGIDVEAIEQKAREVLTISGRVHGQLPWPTSGNAAT